jgi:1-acyl-sn-glycerol-3-phosphate acyltransferase
MAGPGGSPNRSAGSPVLEVLPVERDREPWYRFAVAILKPLMVLLFRRDFRDQDRIPPTGGVIVAANHTSYADAFVVALYIHEAGRKPRFMAKKSVFRVPLAGRVVRGVRAIPVDRHTADAGLALAAAVDAVKAGEAVVIYTEGTITKDPDLWPMRGKTGAARLALETGAPVIPLAQWGVQEFLSRGHFRPLPRKTLQVRVGDPVDLGRWVGGPVTRAHLEECTAEIMSSLTELVAKLRDDVPPAVPFDPRAAIAPAAPSGPPDDDTRRSA